MNVNAPAGLQAEEAVLIERMIRFFCVHRHTPPPGKLCADCATLLIYAQQRIAHCHFGEEKPTCRKCPIHCYNPGKRQQIKDVMKFAGPRMLARGDVAALKHLLRE